MLKVKLANSKIYFKEEQHLNELKLEETSNNTKECEDCERYIGACKRLSGVIILRILIL